ncbi:DUF4249 domain-containing protein [Phocaeicola vulgatus]|nr:DUF4249 domain-containing protein [Phocaeicola vulgatus]
MRFFVYILLFAIFCSCEREYILKYNNLKDEYVIYCIPNNLNDTILIQVLKAHSLNASNEYLNEKDDSISVNIIINKENFNIKDKISMKRECFKNYFFLKYSLKPSDSIFLNVRINNMEYKGHTYIPESFPIISSRLECVPKHNNKALNHYLVKFKDKDKEDFYGIRILRRITIHTERGEKEVIVQPISLVLDDEPLLNNGLGLDNVFDMTNLYFQNIYVFNDKYINGKEYTMHLDFPIYIPEEGTQLEKEEYKLFVYALSKDFYKYIISTNNIYNNDLGSIGLAPIHKRYTNIENGTGFIGGCNIYETEWEELRFNSD